MGRASLIRQQRITRFYKLHHSYVSRKNSCVPHSIEEVRHVFNFPSFCSAYLSVQGFLPSTQTATKNLFLNVYLLLFFVVLPSCTLGKHHNMSCIQNCND